MVPYLVSRMKFWTLPYHSPAQTNCKKKCINSNHSNINYENYALKIVLIYKVIAEKIVCTFIKLKFNISLNILHDYIMWNLIHTFNLILLWNSWPKSRCVHIIFKPCIYIYRKKSSCKRPRFIDSILQKKKILFSLLLYHHHHHHHQYSHRYLSTSYFLSFFTSPISCLALYRYSIYTAHENVFCYSWYWWRRKAIQIFKA